MQEDRNGTDADSRRLGAMTREDLLELLAYLRSDARFADSTMANVVHRSEYRVMLGVAALIVTLLAGSGAFFFSQLISVERSLSDKSTDLATVVTNGDKDLLTKNRRSRARAPRSNQRPLGQG